jgi:hypothetical protein
LPNPLAYASAVNADDVLYIIGGSSTGDSNQLLKLDVDSEQWVALEQMPTARHNLSTVWFNDRLWAIGGKKSGTKTNVVESYDPVTNSWKTETPLLQARINPSCWVYDGNLYAGGGLGNSTLSSIELYDPVIKQWANHGSFPENKYAADAVVLKDNVYVIAGHNGSSFSKKVFAADLNASVEGVYDLYRKDGDAPVGTPIVQSEYADGSVTGSKMADGAITTDKLNEQILKYLKPEITSQPQAQTVYADTNASISVTAEGKYLTYQWKKDGVDLAGETNATLNITDANATLHDGNYSVVVSNDFGSVNSGEILVDVNQSFLNGLVGWWKFDEGSGTVAHDSSGNENDSHLINGPTWVDGKIGGALSFDGLNDYVSIPDIQSSFVNDATLSAWTKIIFPQGGSGSNEWKGGLMHFGTGSNLHYTHVGGTFYINLLRNNSRVDGITHSVNIYEWHNLVITSKLGSYWKMYIDSELLKEVSATSLGIPTNCFIGKSLGTSGTYWLHGLIDDVRIYDRALSAEEVQALYNLGL